MQDMLKGGLTEPEGTTAALWEYIHPVLKMNLEERQEHLLIILMRGLSGYSTFGPAGAWVGGRAVLYISRLGNLGQVAQALPVFGYFVRSLLADPNYSRYTGVSLNQSSIKCGTIIASLFFMLRKTG